MDDSFFDQQNAAYAQALFEEYAKNPDGVPAEWRDFFDQGSDAALDQGLLLPEGMSNGGGSAPAMPTYVPPQTVAEDSTVREELDAVRRLLPVVARATSFVQAYRDHGHTLSRTDPLGSQPPGHPQLDPSFFGTSMEELESIPASIVMEGDVGDESLAHALHRLQAAYCGSIGYQFEHMDDPQLVRWLWSQVESGRHTRPLPNDEKVRLLQRLTEVEGLEQFIHRAYLGQKRFSIEGTDMMVPMLDEVLELAADDGAHTVVIGMAHRGRLNVLAHTVGIGYEEILREFEGVEAKGAFVVHGTGDVKYHHGAEGEREVGNGSTVRVSLAPNPSHLEYVNPVVQGMARSMQFEGDTGTEQDTSSVVPVLIHGDAAFAGEGIVAETLNISKLRGFTTGGTIHIIANNQVGFTTNPEDGRSTPYSSDIAKGFSIPILHVNGDDPEACLAAVRLAMAYRAHYKDDVVIDLVGYRRHGHNEGDEPAYTQPELYAKIKKHPTARKIWADRLVADGVLNAADAEAMQDRINDALRQAQDSVKEEGTQEEPKDSVQDEDLEPHAMHETWVEMPILEEVNKALLATPEGFNVHPKLKRQLAAREDGFGPDLDVYWAHAEALAFGSLLREGIPVRLTGQDVERGTFSHRHLVLHDAENGDTITPLRDYGSGRFEIFNSPLAEMAIVGFEYGVSVMEKKKLVLWEGQFGDFVNCAQVAIDQFVSSGWEKWGQKASLVLLLPHGYEGQGPEHSSARLERFLQLCAENNMRVVSPTTPANYFHVLRLQAHTEPHRPLIVMNPKSLLRLPRATSKLSELTDGGFRHVIDDPDVTDRSTIERLVLCTGKVYYDIVGTDDRSEADKVAVARVEELYPFPGNDLTALIGTYPALKEVVWVQEEPRNMGALSYIGPRLRGVTPRTIALKHVARPERASPAEGKSIDHVVEQARIVREALTI